MMMPDFLPAPGFLLPGRRIYAVGDVHGCDVRLASLHGLIARDLARRPIKSALLIHLGDYIDRGADSARVVRRLIGGPGIPGLSVLNLMGNHEAIMLDALAGDRPAATDWLHIGGRESLMSWGVDPDSPRQTWPDHFVRTELDWLAHLALLHREGGYVFVHAGLRPHVPIERQARIDMLCIRNAFLFSEAVFEGVVVHGHTPADEPVIRANRIGIDTGAVFGGPLTCAVLEEDRIGFLQT